MRIVITQGILDLLEPEEVEGVVAHEIGHGKNWDMLLMTVVQLVPLLLYFLYRTAMQVGGRGKDDAYRIAVAVGAYVLYIASEYIVLWFSRCREYYADRFAGRVTGNPSALASALVKIGYGLAARGQSRRRGGGSGRGQEGQESQEESQRSSPSTRIGALGIFDRKSAVAMVASSASAGFERRSAAARRRRHRPISKENLKSAMQWDLWNPWATFYELNSTHPLVAHRLQYLSDQAGGDGPGAVRRLRPPQARVVLGRFRRGRGRDVPAGPASAGPGPGAGAGRGRGVRRPAGALAWARRMLALVGLPLLGPGDRLVGQDAVRSTAATTSHRCPSRGCCTR